MTVETLPGSRENFDQEVRTALIGLGEGDTRVVDTEIESVEDAGGQAAWRLTLFLTPPVGQAWSVDSTRALKREARHITDRLAEERRLTQEGLTSVLVTTREAREADTAPEEAPDPEEQIDAPAQDEEP